jgi:hypothetical protein
MVAAPWRRNQINAFGVAHIATPDFFAVRWSGDHSCLISKRAGFDSLVRTQYVGEVLR